MYKLTEEGERYLREGLPEKNLIKSLMPFKKKLSELKESISNFQIAIGWARKNKWIDIKDGFVELTEEGKKALEKKTEVEEALEKIFSGKKVPGNILETLLSRKLIFEVKEEKKSILDKIFKKGKSKDIQEIGPLTYDILRTKKWKEIPLKKYDVQAPAPEIWPGKKHIATQVLEQMRRIWIEMGFKEMKGPEVEITFWNFDALFVPQGHPAREMQDTFYLEKPSEGRIPEDIASRVKATHENGWLTGSAGWQYVWSEKEAKRICLRTHTTAVSARTLARLKPEDLPAKFFAIDKVFRNETLDWKHLFELYQIEGIVVDPNVNFRHLLGYLKRFYEKLGFDKVRFRPAYFPYTEMSVEGEVWVPGKGWIELISAGIFRPEVTKPLLGEEIPVLAWGPGFDRTVMMAYELRDIRKLYDNDLSLLRNAKVWVK